MTRELKCRSGEGLITPVDDKVKRLIELHADRAYAIAIRMAGNRDDAGDLVQEAFLRVIKYMKSYDPSLPFEAWLYQIIRNLYLNSLKLEARRRKVPLSVVDRDDDEFSFEDVPRRPDRSARRNPPAPRTRSRARSTD
jgi:RNA polymerase sigma-70 factor (ECF subfamily)